MYTKRITALLATIGASVGLVLFFRWRKRKLQIKLKHKKKQGSVNIGAIFGLDVGGTLTKIVYFETKLNDDTTPRRAVTEIPRPPQETQAFPRNRSFTQLDTPDHQEALQKLYTTLDNTRDGTGRSEIGIQESKNLSFYSSILGGQLHFLHFETRNMTSAIEKLSLSALTENIRTMGCTGGGAHKYAKQFEDILDITVQQQDELACLIRGMHFALSNVFDECYTYRNADVDAKSYRPDDQKCEDSPQNQKQQPFSLFGLGFPQASTSKAQSSPVSSSKQTTSPASPSLNSTSTEDMKNEKNARTDAQWRRDVREYTQKVCLPHDMFTSNRQFPYLVVNIGSGVSIMKVTAPGQFERVSGSSVGGGTYWGLCRLLTSCGTYEETLDLAVRGDASGVDMLVRDIYGGGYDAMNLNSSMVASSFGKLVMKENPREGVKEEDLAIALLMMITNNIGQVSYLNAQLHNCTKIFFVGSFLRHNPISCRRLAFSIDFWSKGKTEALFLIHEGYFGALGTFLLSAFGSEVDKILILSQGGKSGDDQVSEGAALPFATSAEANPSKVKVNRKEKFRSLSPRARTAKLSAQGSGFGVSSADKKASGWSQKSSLSRRSWSDNDGESIELNDPKASTVTSPEGSLQSPLKWLQPIGGGSEEDLVTLRARYALSSDDCDTNIPDNPLLKQRSQSHDFSNSLTDR